MTLSYFLICSVCKANGPMESSKPSLQIKALTDTLHETKRDLRLDPENIQKVVEVALELAGQPPLERAEVPGLWPDPKRKSCPVFRLPALEVKQRPRKEDSAEVYVGDEFIGVLFRDDDEKYARLVKKAGLEPQ